MLPPGFIPVVTALNIDNNLSREASVAVFEPAGTAVNIEVTMMATAMPGGNPNTTLPRETVLTLASGPAIILRDYPALKVPAPS
jgi:hypothetical protein